MKKNKKNKNDGIRLWLIILAFLLMLAIPAAAALTAELYASHEISERGGKYDPLLPEESYEYFEEARGFLSCR